MGKDPPTNRSDDGTGPGRMRSMLSALRGWVLPRKATPRKLVGTVWIAALVSCSVFLVAVMAVPRQAPSAPSGTLVVASLPFWHIRDGTNTVLQHDDAINEVSPWMYGLAEDGRLTTQYPPQRAERVDASLRELRDAGVPIMPSLANITDGAWSYQPVARILHDPALRGRHVAEIVELVNRENYIGIDVDYENLRAGDREVFSGFVRELGTELHRHGKLLSVALFAKADDAGYDERNLAQDYAAIGRYADEVRLMAYDFHWSTSPPGPVAPIEWVRDVLDYAKTRIPPEKIVLGVPLYGYDWSDGHATSVTWRDAFRLAQQHRAQPRYDTRSQSPWFRYTDARGREHEVWFENSASSKAKFEAARGAGIRGVYLWMYGRVDDGTWGELRNSLPTE